MLDIKFIRENPESVKDSLKKRGVSIDIDRLLELDKIRRSLLQAAEGASAEQNKISETIVREKNADEKAKLIAKAHDFSEKREEAQRSLKDIDAEYESLLLSVPNLPQEDVPVGKDSGSNIVLREEGKKPKFNFDPKSYLDIAEKLDFIDVKRAAKVSGTRFGYLKGAVAQLEFALVRLALDTLVKEGFVLVVPPVMIRADMMKAMGYIDTEEDKAERYFFEQDDLYLVGTSEQAVGPMHADEIFELNDLPRRYVAFSTCFRREAGSYGKDTKGILRVHQFDKVEMLSFCNPENSKNEHKFLLSMAEKLMQKLEIPYRVVQLCTGDLSRPSATTIDIESWMPGQPSTDSGRGTYRETHSISNCTDFQTRRLNVRYRSKEGKLHFVHLLNGTAFAIGRILIAIIENNQQKNGSVKLPKALQKYIGKAEIIEGSV